MGTAVFGRQPLYSSISKASGGLSYSSFKNVLRSGFRDSETAVLLWDNKIKGKDVQMFEEGGVE